MASVGKGEAVEVECPFCERPLFAVAEPQLVIHSRPACSDFQARTAEEVVRAVSDAAARGNPC
jgi:hypothetical protein